ncbi:hypothetical protein [Hansschlegelia zhihuaiae]|uniref:Uncharacterized protein n=1 Tax=Hansschlegelia zhihuaiae TaxID=405005 RepID=A0A4Q0MMI8_9HYPH|nr:hypothetical protein [Hansschlegelia zhihuaiae]RXF74803.1 hypothetical protein EK403_05360 [Hansschlegelia zhihuaiae]
MATPLRGVTFEEYEEVWYKVYQCMQRYAKKKNFVLYIDYDVYEPFNGWSQVLIDILNLEVLTARLVAKLRRLVKRRPGWEIMVGVALDEHLGEWPAMGLRIRADEVIDDLQRSYLPPKYRSLAFIDARPGTPDDW